LQEEAGSVQVVRLQPEAVAGSRDFFVKPHLQLIPDLLLAGFVHVVRPLLVVWMYPAVEFLLFAFLAGSSGAHASNLLAPLSGRVPAPAQPTLGMLASRFVSANL